MDLQDFEYYRDILQNRSGLIIGPDKTYLLDSRLTPVAKKWGYNDVIDMTKNLRNSRNEELVTEIVEAMTTNETSFFRDMKPFTLMEKVVLPDLLEARKARKSLRIWCAACSSGQEPYSLSMMLKEMGPAIAGWNIEIVATDISHQILDQARKGIFTQFEVQRGLPIGHLMKYMDKEGEKWQLKDEIRSMVTFKYLNLLEPFVGLGSFDIVFCRNVLIYFNEQTKRKVLDSISGVLANDGYLFLGGAETVLGLTDKFKLKEGQRGLYIKGGNEVPGQKPLENLANRG